MSMDFILEKLGMIILLLGIIITVSLISNALYRRIYFGYEDRPFNEIHCIIPTKQYLTIKRIIDIILGIVAIIGFLLIYLFIPVLIKIFIGGPVFKKKILEDSLTNRQIEFYVFSTSKDNSNVNRLGKFIRTYSIDELPKVVNLLRGDVSLVGRAPLNKDYWRYFAPDLSLTQKEILKKYPIGLVDLSYLISTTSYLRDRRDILQYDLIYASKASIKFDFYLLFRTLISFFAVKSSY